MTCTRGHTVRCLCRAIDAVQRIKHGPPAIDHTDEDTAHTLEGIYPRDADFRAHVGECTPCRTALLNGTAPDDLCDVGHTLAPNWVSETWQAEAP